MPSHRNLAARRSRNRCRVADLIADRIRAYLASDQRHEDGDAIGSMAWRIGQRFAMQFCRTRTGRKGHMHTTMLSRGCARYAWHKYHGTPEGALEPEVQMNFWIGDLGEASLIALARLAGVNVEGNNAPLQVLTPTGEWVTVHPDGWYRLPDGTVRNVEFKKVRQWSMEHTQETGKVDNDFGYLSQASMEIAAERGAGLSVTETEFVLFAPENGEWASILMPYDQALVSLCLSTVSAACGLKAPPRLDTEPEVEWDRDLHARVQTGRSILPLLCRFCPFRVECWPEAERKVRTFKIPRKVESVAWVLPEKVTA